MSVNRAQTMKPLLYLAAGEQFPEEKLLQAVQGIVVDAAALASLRQPDRGQAPCLLLARIGPAEPISEEDLSSLLAGVDGIVLTACRGPADIQKLDVMLKVAEAAAGMGQGRTALLAEYATLAESVLSPHSMAGVSPRLSALVFDASALAEACGCRRATGTGDVPAVVRAGRAAAVLRASEAGIASYEMLPADAVDEAAVRRLWTNSLDNGFSAVAAGSPRQIELLADAASDEI
ncbi:aldolase/citrate lyase family protein [Sinorhizobium americanum]|uniref:HpcH/HpaI aldolase/citrate lyase family protein n=1 Tax=Sinorhizobium americanum TaxID=194963 RepID=A0A4R2AZH1_9HYPH|nr:aldolase/citrate lyase family protein [Sinorhizobium americanum]TCN18482.1 HpcH/HpaI aldolase/citrate lyase family protein [Sinorhizobium americanum]